ncbi:MAG: glycosyltransferase [Firmicutes bacterium]|nr:glycosyltransferase [Candidatus Caballimonas caccae]
MKLKSFALTKIKKNKEGYYILDRIKNNLVYNIAKKNNVILPRFDKDIIYEAVKDADVVHILIPLFIARKTSKFVKSLGIPITSSFHAQAQNFTAQFHILKCKIGEKHTYKMYYNNLYKYADAVHYPTQFIRDIFETSVKKKTNGYVISNGVNDMFKPIQVEKKNEFKDKFCILFTGRLSREKSHKVLIKAVNKSKYKDKIQLFFAGDGPTKKDIIKYSKKHLSNEPIIDFYSREELLKLINSCDLYCHPAYAEIEAISCLEAISCGLVPLIANSPCCATKKFAIDNRCLFKVNDSRDLAKKIDYFIEHPECIKELREKYLLESTSFNQTKCMEQMEQMLIETAKLKKKD